MGEPSRFSYPCHVLDETISYKRMILVVILETVPLFNWLEKAYMDKCGTPGWCSNNISAA